MKPRPTTRVPHPMEVVLRWVILPLVLFALLAWSLLAESLPALPASAAVVETNSSVTITVGWKAPASTPVPVVGYDFYTNGVKLGNTVSTTYTYTTWSLPVTNQVASVGSNGARSALTAPLVYPTPVTNIWVWIARRSTNFPASRSQLATAGEAFTNWAPLVFTNVDSTGTNFPRPQEWFWVVATNRTL